MGNVLTLAFKANLLSSLIPIRYEDTIDSVTDLYKSGLPIILSEGFFVTKYFREDPSEMTSQIMKRAIMAPFQYPPPKWVFEM